MPKISNFNFTGYFIAFHRILHRFYKFRCKIRWKEQFKLKQLLGFKPRIAVSFFFSPAARSSPISVRLSLFVPSGVFIDGTQCSPAEPSRIGGGTPAERSKIRPCCPIPFFGCFLCIFRPPTWFWCQIRHISSQCRYLSIPITKLAYLR